MGSVLRFTLAFGFIFLGFGHGKRFLLLFGKHPPLIEIVNLKPRLKSVKFGMVEDRRTYIPSSSRNFLSYWLCSGEHAFPSSPGFITPLASRQAKYASLHSQHFCRSFLVVRSGSSAFLLPNQSNQPIQTTTFEETGVGGTKEYGQVVAADLKVI